MPCKRITLCQQQWKEISSQGYGIHSVVQSVKLIFSAKVFFLILNQHCIQREKKDICGSPQRFCQFSVSMSKRQRLQFSPLKTSKCEVFLLVRMVKKTWTTSLCKQPRYSLATILPYPRHSLVWWNIFACYTDWSITEVKGPCSGEPSAPKIQNRGSRTCCALIESCTK